MARSLETLHPEKTDLFGASAFIHWAGEETQSCVVYIFGAFACRSNIPRQICVLAFKTPLRIEAHGISGKQTEAFSHVFRDRRSSRAQWVKKIYLLWPCYTAYHKNIQCNGQFTFQMASALSAIHQGTTKPWAYIFLMGHVKQDLFIFCNVNSDLNPNSLCVALTEECHNTQRYHSNWTVTLSRHRLVGCCLGRTRCLRNVWHERLYVFRVVSPNLERLCHKYSRLFDRKECLAVSTSVTSGAGFRGWTLLFKLRKNVDWKSSRNFLQPGSQVAFATKPLATHCMEITTADKCSPVGCVTSSVEMHHCVDVI